MLVSPSPDLLPPPEPRCRCRRVQRDGIVYVYLADKTLTSPVICSRRKGELPSPAMQDANAILEVLVENRRSGRYP
ncbi:hypothetical protein [Billgrantia montanilacus]|uniref:hypothetical protein n=1 Tax=Billgrantia montanilacus TaxID=2282305 RepID=UPI001FE28D46|nr:hypothetical protein [Halomonas montanilacus]